VISNLTLTDEFELAAREYKLTPRRSTIATTAASAAFAEPSVKQELGCAY